MITPSGTIQGFAEQVLLTDDLASKLLAPSTHYEDIQPRRPRPFLRPDFPARPPGLSLNPGASPARKRTQSAFPARSRLCDDRARGLVLHFFANHELLALEIMALALLKWPDAPSSFRRGIVETMIEEQNHMRLYLDRMRDLKVAFGETPLNAFFWHCMKDLESPMEYAAAMSMTFEQANLDFSLHYEKLFRVEGDTTSAEILRRVREEEIGHVKHGVVWFDRWRPKSERLFKEWQDCLKFPMTPARAKGIEFDRLGRAKASLTEEFIDELEVHNQSKGRPPRVFWFNPGCEHEVEARSNNWTPPKPIQQLTSDYAPLMSLLAHESDVVVVKEAPTVEFLKSLDQLGFPIPEFLRKQDLASLKSRKIWSLEPWGWSPAARDFFAPLRHLLIGENFNGDSSPSTARESIFSKALAAELRTKFNLNDPPTILARSLKEIQSYITEFANRSPSKTVVLKSPFSTSGRGMIRIKEPFIGEKDAAWINSVLEKHDFVICEPWLDKKIDLSAHIDISPTGVVKFIGCTRFWTDTRGQYRGHILGRLLDNLGSNILQMWHAPGGWQDQLRETAIKVGHEAFKRGYSGPLGVDAFVYRTQDGMKLRPLLEINPRWSMGRLALAITPRLAAKHCGLWLHASSRDLEKSGHKNFQGLLSHLQQNLPLDLRHHGGAKAIHQGVIALNDPSQAMQSLALLVVGRDFDQCYDVLKSGGLHDPQLEL